MGNYEEILFKVEGKVAVITLNRPEALNSLTLQLMAEVQDALSRVEENRDIRALVITGAGKGFCAGQDLKNRTPPGVDIVEALMEAYYPVFKGIRESRVPVIMAINGVAAGGGASLALSGDIILSSDKAKFIQVFSRIGLSPDLGSTYLVPRAIGRARALEMMMTNDPVAPEKAVEWGMINRCVPHDQLMAEAMSLAKRLADGATRAISETRRMVDRTQAEIFEATFREELEVNKVLRESYDSKEGVAAFIEKRKAEFKGE